MRQAIVRYALSALAVAAFSSSAFAEARTTRIETRPYYGAVVTVEQGVRVWRPLPPHDRIIIDPTWNYENGGPNGDAMRLPKRNGNGAPRGH